MNAGTCWEQEYNRSNGLSVEKSSKKQPLPLPFDVSSIFHGHIKGVTIHFGLCEEDGNSVCE